MSNNTPGTDGAILDALVAEGELSVAIRTTVQRYAERWSCSYYLALLETGVVSESKLADTLSLIARVPRLHGIASQHIAPAVLETLPYECAKEIQAIPVAVIDGSGKIEVAVANPADSADLARLRKAAKAEIVLAVGERSDIVSAIDGSYPLKDRWPSVWDCVKSQ